MDKLEAIGPIDGRYRRYTEVLAPIFSEQGLIHYRVMVEGEYLIALSEKGIVRVLTVEEKQKIRSLYNVSVEDATLVKAIETKGHGTIKATNHDVKAVEYFMKERLAQSSLKDCLEWIHFGLTSWDINNIAHALMLSDGITTLLPTLQQLHDTIEAQAQQYKDVPMLARTHGQPASPTTVGKEFKIFSARLKGQLEPLKRFEIAAKLNGATGNYNAHYSAYPKVDWIGFTESFVNSFNAGRTVKLRPNFVTTQVEPRDSYVELFDLIRRINMILLDFNQDVWRYISDDWFQQKPVEGEVGSSTMPHKINPIDFENSEGNLGLANTLFSHFAAKLPISRLQRDLSDSTVERNYGVALAYCLIAYQSALKGLNKIVVNEQKVREELKNHPEVIAEAIQTVLRREGVEMPYEKLKTLTRGRRVTMDDFHKFIDELSVSPTVKQELKQITPSTYTGLAKHITERY